MCTENVSAKYRAGSPSFPREHNEQPLQRLLNPLQCILLWIVQAKISHPDEDHPFRARSPTHTSRSRSQSAMRHLPARSRQKRRTRRRARCAVLRSHLRLPLPPTFSVFDPLFLNASHLTRAWTARAANGAQIGQFRAEGVSVEGCEFERVGSIAFCVACQGEPDRIGVGEDARRRC